jgi:hypothetical protein
METENGELREAADMMWFKRGIGEVETGDRDPFEFAAEVSAKDWDVEFFEKIVPLIESKCLEKIRLLENYQLNLRGDCVDKSRVDSVEEYSVYGTLRNKQLELKSPDEKYLALGSALSAVVKVYGTAQMYWRRAKSETRSEDKLPVIMYGFNKFGDSSGEDKSIDDIYFKGDADDIGNRVSEMHFLEIPTHIMEASDGADKEPFFSNPPWPEDKPYETAESSKKRLKRFDPVIREHEFMTELLHPKACAKAMVILDTLLVELASYDERTRGVEVKEDSEE